MNADILIDGLVSEYNLQVEYGRPNALLMEEALSGNANSNLHRLK